MTREEAIARIKDHIERHRIGEYPHIKLAEALDMALSALRPVSREQVEKVWRSYWDGFSNDYADGYEVYDEWQCRKCGFEVETDEPETLPQFCPNCGAPMTDEAVDIIMRRLETLYETT